MLERLKAVVQIKDELDQVKGKFDVHSESINGLSLELQGLREQMSEFKKQQDEFGQLQKSALENLYDNINEINKIHLKYRDELDNFFVLKKDISTKIMKRFENELGEQLIKHSAELTIKTENYRKIKRDLEMLGESMTTFNGEVSKLKIISSSIKKEDFELKNFAKELADADRHKLELMQKIDSLQRLVAKQRRRG